jgi:hypothetical protein
VWVVAPGLVKYRRIFLGKSRVDVFRRSEFLLTRLWCLRKTAAQRTGIYSAPEPLLHGIGGSSSANHVDGRWMPVQLQAARNQGRRFWVVDTDDRPYEQGGNQG